jgi:hypothetical protein
MTAKTASYLAKSRIEYDPYPDTGETGEAYEAELPGILEEIRARIHPIRLLADMFHFEQVEA